MKIRSSFEFCKSLGEAKIGILSESQNYRKKKKENTDNIKYLKNQNKIFDKILECVIKGQIKEKGDLKLFGITEPQLQKEVLWSLFEEKVVKTNFDLFYNHKDL